MNEKDKYARQVVDQLMRTDAFSRWMNLQILEVKDGYSKLSLTVSAKMLNGFGIVHGGIIFSLADSAFAFACNSNGKLTLALDANIAFAKPAKEGETIFATAEMVNSTRKTGIYVVKVVNEQNELVAFFKGTSYKTEKDLL